jgi:hypothetical protein
MLPDNVSVGETQTEKVQTAELLVCFSQKSDTYIYKVYQQNTKPPIFGPINATLCIKSLNGKKRIREGKTAFFTKQERPKKNTLVFDRKHLMF